MKSYNEENGYYSLQVNDETKVLSDINSLFHSAGVSILNDTDFVISDIENNQNILVEYKNGTVGKSEQYNGFNPNDDRYITKVARKFYDTMLFLNHIGIEMPLKYVYILEYPNDDVITRNSIKNKIKPLLPFKLQKTNEMKYDMISDFDVLSIEEWNTTYPNYPFVRIKE